MHPSVRAEFLIRTAAVLLATAASGLAQAMNETWIPHGQTSADIINRVVNERDDSANYYNRLREHGDIPPGDFVRRNLVRDIRSYPRSTYFAPIAPVLGERPTPANTASALQPPATLAQFSYEPFYPALSSLILLNRLSNENRQRVELFSTGRDRLLKELHAQLYAPATSDATVLSKFAADQASRLTALAENSEAIRRDLTRSADFAGQSDWHDLPRWHFAGETGRDRAVTEIQVLLAFAAFQEGFSREQRHLLQEMAAERVLAMNASEAAKKLPEDVLFFSPFGARIRLSADVPENLRERIAAYREAKDAIKSELLKAVHQQDRTWFNSKRANALREVAAHQASAFARLDVLAEEVRRGLALHRRPTAEDTMSLPAALVQRIRAYQEKKAAFQNTLIAKTSELKAALPMDQIEYARSGDTYVLRVVANPNSSREQNGIRQGLSETLALFNHTQGAAYTQLSQEHAAIRADVLQLAATQAGPSPSRSVDELMSAFAAASQRQQLADQYRDYETAVLLPALSPAQRDLLFGAALEKLNLPLRTDALAQ